MDTLAFNNWLVLNGRSLRTVERHDTNLAVLKKSLEDWSDNSIREFIVNLKVKRGLRNASINSYISTIKHYLTFKGETFNHIKYFKEEKAVKGFLSNEEAEAIYKMKRQKGSPALRWYMFNHFFELVCLTGCRPHEIADLKPEFIDWGRNVFVITHSKTGQIRNLMIPPQSRGWLQALTQKTKQGDYIFKTSKGKKLTDRTWDFAFNVRKKVLGINRVGITCYSFRHSYVNNLLNEGVNTHVVAKTMGHRIEETVTYEHLTTKDICEAMKKHPLVRKATSPQEILRELVETIQRYELNKDDRFIFMFLEKDNGIDITVRVR